MPPVTAIASNLARLRRERGLSQAELGESAELSRLALGKIERGETVPRERTLSALADALGVPLSRLLAQQRVLQRVRFRAPTRVNGREGILGDVAAWLEGYAELEKLLDEPAAKLHLARRSKSPRKGEASTAAAVRKAFALGDEPIRDICGLLEAHGIKVLLLARATEAFFGLSVGPEDGGPAVIVNTWERISVERWIFSAAHELGHLALHLDGDAFDRADAEDVPEEEREADRFASALLLPETTFRKEWEETAGRALLDRVLKVKRIFRVSYQTVLLRLIAMKEADKTVWGKFQRQHLGRYGRSLRKVDEPHALNESDLTSLRANEPERLLNVDFGGDRLHRLVRRALDEVLISMGRAAELLRISREDMRKLARQWHD